MNRQACMVLLVLCLVLVSTAVAQVEDADVARGGSLYDTWWSVTGAAAPTTNHPLWALRPDTVSNTREGAVTWRCKECHGWDYKGRDGAYGSGSHRTGIAGISGTAKTAQEVFDLIKTDHAYGAAGLSDPDIWDLTKFVLAGQIDTDGIIDATGAFQGRIETGRTLYDSGIGTNLACAACHGTDGLTPPPGYPEFDQYVGLLSNENPWEFQHKVRFGQPGTAMPGSVAGGGTDLNVADLGAYAQTLPQEPRHVPVVRGGAMYDTWWAVVGVAKPTTDHPLWALRPDTTSNTRTGADTWRCKECHGWDYRGVDGAYGKGSHRTGFAGILCTTKTVQEVFDLIKIDHAYETVGLSDEDVRDLVVFVLEGLINTGSIIDADGIFVGNAATGQTLYDAGIGPNVGCAACHGTDGLTPPPGYPDFEDYVGLLSNENPWEFQHKVRFGHPGTAMPSSIAGGGTILDAAHLGAYSQTLPQEPAPETITFDPNTPGPVLSQGKAIFEGTCGVCHSLPTANDVKAFSTDDALVALAAPMAQWAGLSKTDAEYVIRYLLALRHDVLVTAARQTGQPWTVAMLAWLSGVGVYVPARRWRRRRAWQPADSSQRRSGRRILRYRCRSCKFPGRDSQ